MSGNSRGSPAGSGWTRETASWEKGLNYVAEGTITSKEYMDKLNRFVAKRTEQVRGSSNQAELRKCFEACAPYYIRTGKPRKQSQM